MARKKKNRNSRKPGGPPGGAFRIGSPVRVKRGTIDPDFPDIPLGGWAGTVREIDSSSRPPIYQVAWNRETIAAQPPHYRRRCDEKDLDPDSIWLGSDDLEPDQGGTLVLHRPPQEEPPDLVGDTPEERIRALFAVPADVPLPELSPANQQRYLRYLKEKIRFPFVGAYLEEDEETEELTPRPLAVIDVLPPLPGDPPFVGIRARAIDMDEGLELPLNDVYCAGKDPLRPLLDDYRYWTENAYWPDEDGEPGEAEKPEGPLPVSAALKPLALMALACAGAGATVGAAFQSMDGGRTGIYVAGGLLALLGCLVGGWYENLSRGSNRRSPGALTGGILGGIAGAAIGAVLGALVVPFVGSILGALGGTVLGQAVRRLKLPTPGELPLALLGACVGACAYMLYQDQEKALNGAVYGALAGAAFGPLYLIAFTFVMALVAGPPD